MAVDQTKPNHFIHDSLGDPATCTEDHNHPEPEPERKPLDRLIDLAVARMSPEAKAEGMAFCNVQFNDYGVHVTLHDAGPEEVEDGNGDMQDTAAGNVIWAGSAPRGTSINDLAERMIAELEALS
ncbi:hypothetical protein SEA_LITTLEMUNCHKIN_49 [Gordonia phage LittleMunchkin]|nr:hypothetical protein SEA_LITTLEMUNCHKIN_49 [Gordonia phage LittleMunchkin]